MKNITAKTVAVTGLLFALALTLSFAESLIPVVPGMPPGIKMGLSNIVTMFCLFCLGPHFAIGVVVLKAGFTFLTRGVTAGLLSFSGGLFSSAIMILLLFIGKRRFSFGFTSISGAVAHNIGQLVTARILIGSNAIFYYLPVLLISGIIMGTITGAIYRITGPHIEKVYQTTLLKNKQQK